MRSRGERCTSSGRRDYALRGTGLRAARLAARIQATACEAAASAAEASGRRDFALRRAGLQARQVEALTLGVGTLGKRHAPWHRNTQGSHGSRRASRLVSRLALSR